MSALLLLAGPAWSAEITVHTEDGLHAIQEAVDSAAPGDSIWVEPGAYAGFVVDKDHLTVSTAEAQLTGPPLEVPDLVYAPGLERRVVIIDPTGGDIHGVTVSGFTFQGNRYNVGVHIENGHDITIAHNVFEQQFAAVDAFGLRASRVVHNQIDFVGEIAGDSALAINLNEPVTRNVIAYNHIVQQTIGRWPDDAANGFNVGIAFYEDPTRDPFPPAPTVTNNLVSNNTIALTTEFLALGVWFADTLPYGSIAGNVVVSNDLGAFPYPGVPEFECPSLPPLPLYAPVSGPFVDVCGWNFAILAPESEELAREANNVFRNLVNGDEMDAIAPPLR